MDVPKLLKTGFLGAMSLLKFEPKFFKIRALKGRLGIRSIMENEGVVVTYNQLMKSGAAFRYVFIFDENSIEVPSLISYCNYFGVELFKLQKEEAAEVRSAIGYAQMVCIPCKLAQGLPHDLRRRLEEAGRSCTEIAQDISRIDLGS